jgi:hypothetical protein
MNAKSFVVPIGFVVLAIVLLLSDYILSKSDEPGSWEVAFRVAFRTTPVYPWTIGVLFGHLYHPFGEPPFRDNLRPPFNMLVDPLGKWPFLRIAVALSPSVMMAALGWFVDIANRPFIPAWTALVAGIVLGSIVWPTSAARNMKQQGMTDSIS